MTHPVITLVTDRIRERSTARRARFLARIQRQADQGPAVAAGQGFRIYGKDRQDQEQAQHAQGENGSQRGADAALLRTHTIGWGGHFWNILCNATKGKY